jgi:hypothetical protein
MKPHIICTSPDDAEEFNWFSDGWFESKKRHTKKAQDLFAKAKACIRDGKDVPDAIKLLEAAGFRVSRREGKLPDILFQ